MTNAIEEVILHYWMNRRLAFLSGDNIEQRQKYNIFEII